MQTVDRAQSKYFDLAVEILLLAIMYLVPTVFDRTIGIVFSGTKIAVIRIILLLIFSIWACKILVFREHKFIRSLLDWPIASYMLACTVATLASVHVLVSWVGFYGRYEGLSTIYLWALLFFVVTNFINTKEQYRRIFISVISAGTLMSVYGIIQRWGSDPYSWGGVVTWQRVIATIGQPNFLAAYVIMAFFFGLGMLVMDKERPRSPGLELKTKKSQGKKGPAAPDRAMEGLNQALIVSPFVGSLIAFLVMIYWIDTSNFFSLFFCWLVITALAVAFSFASRDIEPAVLDGLLLFCLPLIYTCILFTQSRGGMFALFGSGALFLALVNRENLLKNWKKFLILGVTIFAITAVTFTNPLYSPIARLSEEVKVENSNPEDSGVAARPKQVETNVNVEKSGPAESDRKKDIGLELKGAAGSRIETWKSALAIISDHYFFGIGPEDLKMVFPRYETNLFRFKEAFHVKQDRCHNEVCDVSVTKGVISLFIYFWLLITFYYLGVRKLRANYDVDLKIYIASMLVAATSYFMQNQFSFCVIAISTLLWAMIGLVSVPELVDEKELELPPFKGISLADIPWLPVATVIFLLFVGCYFSTRQYMADKYFKDGKNAIQFNQFDKALADLKRSMEYFPYEGGTITHYGITLLNVAQSAPAQDKAAWFGKALDAFKFGNVVDPYNADNFYIMGKVYISLYQFNGPPALDSALDCSNKAIAIDPYYAEAYHNRGVIYEARGQLDLAAAEYERAFMIYPDLGIAERQLFVVYSRMGNPDIALQKLNIANERYPNNMFILENIGVAYSELGRNAEAINFFGEMVRLDPNNVAAKVNLAMAYIRAGDLKNAKSHLLDAYVKDPTNVSVHNNLGMIYYREGNGPKAIEEFQQVLMLDPQNEYAKQMLGSMGVK
jgi:tetratricopeptide (TPR) repeat protein